MNGSILVHAKQFTPAKFYLSGDCLLEDIKFWPHNGYQPRDTSFGFVLVDGEKVHIMAGDWIIKIGKQIIGVCRATEFSALKNRLEIRAAALISEMT